MFKDSNIILFLLCLAPVILYSVIIFFNSPTLSIRIKTSFTYLYTGLLSITLLQFIYFIFPHIHDSFFKSSLGGFNINNEHYEIYQSTLMTIMLFAFIQVALMEELSKWIAFKCTDFMRGKRRKNLDHPYTIMFYSMLTAAAFSIVENIQYAQRAMVGEFGNISAESVLTTRAVTSVIVHMACGLFMGYYMALSKGCTKVKRILYNILGILSAMFIHGIYDFAWMVPNSEKNYYVFFETMPIHIPSLIIISFSIIIAFFMSLNLKHIKHSEIKQ